MKKNSFDVKTHYRNVQKDITSGFNSVDFISKTSFSLCAEKITTFVGRVV